MRHKLTEIFNSQEIKSRLKSLSNDLEMELSEVIYLQALTHRSFIFGDASEAVEDNERLEFIGDGVANMIVGAKLYKLYPKWDEGELSQAKSILVSEEVFSQSAHKMNLVPHIIMSESEEQSGARERSNVSEDAFEAFIGAIFITQGLQACEKIFERFHFPNIDENLANPLLLNGKSLLMELCQKNKWPIPEYIQINETGLEHEKEFTFQVQIGNKVLAVGSGLSKKSVQKKIALNAYFQIMENKEFKVEEL